MQFDKAVESDVRFMRRALGLARRAYGNTSPNPLVGALLVKNARVIGQGWHHRAGEAHAEIEAIGDAERRRFNLRGATLYVTLEPCSTHGRTPPCVDAIIRSGIRRVVIAATDPNPGHSGKAYVVLRKNGISVTTGILEREATQLNEAFNHWIVHGTPWVTVKAAMTLDGKIATVAGDSKWITGEASRHAGLNLRRGADAILAGINTILADDPSLTARAPNALSKTKGATIIKPLHRIILDSAARTPLSAKVLSDEYSRWTTVVVTQSAPKTRIAKLSARANVLEAPAREGKIDLRWLLRKLGQLEITSLLVEGGGEVNASFLLGGYAHRIAFFYAPIIVGGAQARKGVAGLGAELPAHIVDLQQIEWKRVAADLQLTARLAPRHGGA